MSPTDPIPTLSDVATRAGVSTATVSRCLNAPDKVVAATREKVLAAIEELGYAPNFAAQVMASRRTHTIGAIIPTMENAIFAQGLQAFQESLHKAGYTLLVASSSYKSEVEEEQIRALISRGADGLLLIGLDRRSEIRDFIASRRVPALVAWTLTEDPAHASIGFDNVKAMQELAEHVIGLGHRRLAIISAETETNDRARGRVAGIHAAIAGTDVDVERIPHVVVPYSIENGAQAFDQVMEASPKPTCIFCGNDVLAVGALRRARERGFNVPDDVSITGFDDIELARVAVPGLTTVHVPHAEMGRRAAELLLEMVNEDRPPATIALDTELRLRGSLGPPVL